MGKLIIDVAMHHYLVDFHGNKFVPRTRQVTTVRLIVIGRSWLQTLSTEKKLKIERRNQTENYLFKANVTASDGSKLRNDIRINIL